MKYFRREESGHPEELTWEKFVEGMRGEFFFADIYRYEYTFVLFGLGHRLIGSSHMYWVEDD
jgi:hypothetical protein